MCSAKPGLTEALYTLCTNMCKYMNVFVFICIYTVALLAAVATQRHGKQSAVTQNRDNAYECKCSDVIRYRLHMLFERNA